MAQATVDNSFEEVLKILLDTIDRIFCEEVPDINSYLKTYTLVYDYCTSGSIANAESRLYTTANGRQKYLLQMCDISRNYMRVAGGELYYNIETYLINRVRKICQLGMNLEKEDLLPFYANQWRQYQISSDTFNRTFHYLNRHWIRRAYDSGIKATHEIFTLCMLIWREILWKSLQEKLTDACSNLIQSYRHSHVGGMEFLDEVIKSYKAINFPEVMFLWLDDQLISVPNEDIYANYFEKPFLQDTTKFYQSQTVFDFEHASILQYLEKITPSIDNDIQGIYPYLSSSMQRQMMELIEKIFFKDYLNMIYNQADILIDKEDIQGLKIIYQSIKHISNIKNDIANRIEDHFHQVATIEIEGVKETAINDPKSYVETMINIHQKFFRFVQETFNGEQRFITALDKVCGIFINNNAMTQTVGNVTKSPELLARYCDALLRKGTKAVEETDLEDKFNQIMIIFNYIDDKDVFLKFYQKMLAKRLVGRLSASDDYEESMISKLKQTCGFEYTSKLQRMFQDIGVSKTLIVEYEKYCESNQVTRIVDFSVMVLSSNSWPFSASLNFVLPIELKSTFDSFTDFYTHLHNGRKLTWLHQHSRGELQTFFKSQKYILQISVYQMVVLLLFNKVLTCTVEQIQDETQIKSELLLPILFGLLKSKLLVCTDINEDELDEDYKETVIKTNYSIRLSTDFKSKTFRINLNVPLKSVEQKDIEGVHRTIDEDRKMVIQAAIVRIMKARQTLKHALLMQEVIQQLSSHFKPSIPIIKKCIDLLVEKEYLERDSKDKDLLRYLT